MTTADRTFRLRQLVEGVRVLSLEPVEQLVWIGDGSVDELGLAFDDGFKLVPTLRMADGVVFEPEALSMLQEIDRRLAEMSGQENAEVWTATAVRSDRRWHELRILARTVAPALPVV